MSFLLLACGADGDSPKTHNGEPNGSTALTAVFSTPPSVIAADVRAPLGALVVADSGAPTTVSVRVSGPEGTRNIDYLALANHHELPLIDLLPDTSYDIEVTASQTDGTFATSSPLPWTTGSLPSPTPVVTRMFDTDGLLPVWWLMTIRRTDGKPGGHLLLLAPDGRIAWVWTDSSEHAMEVIQEPTGDLLTQLGDGVVTLDGAGRQLSRWSIPDDPHTEAILVDGMEGPFHHDVERLPDGTLLSLTSKHLTIAGFPIDYEDASLIASSRIAADVIVNFDSTGAVLSRVDVDDFMSTTRIGYSALGSRLKDPDSYDWSHANDVSPISGRNAILLSMRHQDTVVLLDLFNSSPIWILSPPDNWTAPWGDRRLTPEDGVVWPFHAHAPVLEGNRLVLLDNGNYRASPFTGAGPDVDESTWTRVVAFDIDETQGRFSEGWALENTTVGQVFSEAVGWIERTAEGHLAVTYGAITEIDGVLVEDLGLSTPIVHLLVVDDSGPEPKVLQETRLANLDAEEAGWLVSRAHPLSGPYPAGFATVTWE